MTGLRFSQRIHIGSIFFLSLLISASLASTSFAYVVKKGDNPSSIAKKHKITVDALLSANRISASNMKIGSKITIPAKKGRIKRRSSSGQKDTIAAGKGRKGGGKVRDKGEIRETASASAVLHQDTYHTVRKGDTLSSLSKKYELSTQELKDLNNIRSRKLRRGERLLVRRIGPKTYTVRKDDTLRKIATRFDMDAADLKALNEIAGDDLQTGQKLYLEQKVDGAVAENYNEVLGRNVEEELKKMAQTEEFAEQPTQDKVITFAKKMLDIPYKFGGTSILGIDCSAYVKKVYGLLGIDLPRTAREQFKEGEAIERGELSIGDLVFFRTYASFPSHVGIYLGNDLFIHASSRGKKVTIDSLETPYYIKRFIGGKRLLSENIRDEAPRG